MSGTFSTPFSLNLAYISVVFAHEGHFVGYRILVSQPVSLKTVTITPCLLAFRHAEAKPEVNLEFPLCSPT